MSVTDVSQLNPLTKVEVLKLFEREYIKCGYLYSGSISQNVIRSNPEFCKLVYELIDEEKLQIRNCDFHSVELPIKHRFNLIQKHSLALVWEKKAPFCYPNHPDPRIGEVTSVKKLLEEKTDEV